MIDSVALSVWVNALGAQFWFGGFCALAIAFFIMFGLLWKLSRDHNRVSASYDSLRTRWSELVLRYRSLTAHNEKLWSAVRQHGVAVEWDDV